MTASGIDSQFGYITESTYATYLAPTKFSEFNSETLKFERERIESKGIRTGRRALHRWTPGIQRVTGNIEMEFAPQGGGTLLKHMFGAISTTGAGDPYTHTFTPGTLDAKSLTIQIAKPSIDGTAVPFNYLGCVITDWEFSAAVNEYLMLKLGIYGAHEELTSTLATASYPTNFSPFVFTQGVITIGGSEYEVSAATVAGKNAQRVDRHFMRTTTPERPKIAIEAGLREYTGSLTSDFISTTAYDRFKNGTEAALVLTFTQSATRTLTITMNVRYDGDTPQVKGHDVLEQTLPYKCVSSTSDAAAITAVLLNFDATP